MSRYPQHPESTEAVETAAATPLQRFGAWVEEPMGSVITATVLTVGSFGLVLSGIWFVNVLL